MCSFRRPTPSHFCLEPIVSCDRCSCSAARRPRTATTLTFSLSMSITAVAHELLSPLIFGLLTARVGKKFQWQSQSYSTTSLLPTGTVATGRKSLCPLTTGPSLLKCCYSGGTVATDRRRPSLLWPLLATEVLTSLCPSLLGATVVTDKLTSLHPSAFSL
jgi:hypothetical protein